MFTQFKKNYLTSRLDLIKNSCLNFKFVKSYNLEKNTLNNLQKAHFNHLKEKEKTYTYQEVKNIVSQYLSMQHRVIQNLPEEYHKFEEYLLNIENPEEPHDYACCGKGCSPCVWDTYDKQLQDFEEIVKNILEILNNHDRSIINNKL
jgi:hypothetical protein